MEIYKMALKMTIFKYVERGDAAAVTWNERKRSDRTYGRR
jgi:hypothetical protein